MPMENCQPAPDSEARGAIRSRRHALALMLGAGGWLAAALEAADGGASVRLAISETEIGRASCRERVEISVGALSLKKKNIIRRGIGGRSGLGCNWSVVLEGAQCR